MLPLAAFPKNYLILPPSAIPSCHLIRSGLDCQIPLSEAAWRLQSEKQAVRCGLPVNRPERRVLQNLGERIGDYVFMEVVQVSTLPVADSA
jgi:hypothetical protein